MSPWKGFSSGFSLAPQQGGEGNAAKIRLILGLGDFTLSGTIRQSVSSLTWEYNGPQVSYWQNKYGGAPVSLLMGTFSGEGMRGTISGGQGYDCNWTAAFEATRQR